MNSLIVCDGDAVNFEAMFGHRLVVLTAPALIKASGVASVSKRRMCVLGDEKRDRWPARYFVTGYTPGQGMVSIDMLDASQFTPCIVGRPPLIVCGLPFTARFTPTVPATLISPPNTPDSMTPSIGRGNFIARQHYARA
ncbi:hypothetical protein [Pararobbsia silviterrae]|uniref:Uncharacterized protein n=1 Tax=Pararobbsia silviterrae TaxID=1792498 RepID=A0A494Y5W8_9BURK|nr:hypothetical protein [Pararobbsia silviterrae]RKP55971.1 hypothetical protein D7S86_12345 [Pararobbsia silviterrae]